MSVEDDYLAELVERLLMKPTIREGFLHREYSRRGLCGELDCLAVSASGRWRYYEYKRRDGKGARRRAMEQFERFYRAFPLLNAVCVYVTGDEDSGWSCRHFHRGYFGKKSGW